MKKSNKTKKQIKINTVVETTIYSKKKVNIKKFTIEKVLKDGSLAKWGVSRNGHRFKTITKTVKNRNELTKIFEDNKKIKDGRKNNVTMKVKQYTGKYIKKTGKVVNGVVTGVHYFNIDKKKIREKGGKIFAYTNDVEDLINTLVIKLEGYNVNYGIKK